ncbi:MAG: glycosyltransferase family 2 protein [Nanoarchaeota archaeon]|nr:glycosyltransferase family 2 protein [Nanoarchaeota archaeon]
MQKISIIMPAYNEEKKIRKTLDKLVSYFNKNKFVYEIIIVDDGSTDKTIEIIKEFEKLLKIRILINKMNKGKGYSVKKGILNAKYPLVLVTDADLATPIEELAKFLKIMKQGFDIIIASRGLKESKLIVKQPFYRQIMGTTFPLLVRLLALSEFKDTQCGFKLFKTDVAKKIVNLQTIERFCFDVEILFIAKKIGCKIKETPVTWISKQDSKVRIIKDTLNMLADLFRIRLNDLSKKYEINHID